MRGRPDMSWSRAEEISSERYAVCAWEFMVWTYSGTGVKRIYFIANSATPRRLNTL
jgi:hypothetical protein